MQQVRAAGSFDQSLEFAQECKLRGNEHFKAQDYDAAVNEYERCLSVFDWVEPTDKDWKKKVCYGFVFIK